MANSTTEKKYNPSIEGLVCVLAQFKEDAKCLCEAFDVSEISLDSNKQKVQKELEDFIFQNKVQDNEGKNEISVPHNKEREYKKLQEQAKRAERACQLVRQNFLVSLVSVYDLFYAEIVRVIYLLNPNIIKGDETQFLYRTLLDYGSIGAVEKYIIEKKIDSLIRDSHLTQISWLENTLGVKTLREFTEWGSFMELTERRNLFVHSNGVVSSQYITICEKHNALDKSITAGTILSINKEYFLKAYKTLYKMAVSITAIVANICCKVHYKGYFEDIDRMIINHVYDAITEQEYDLAIDISNFILTKPFRHKSQDKCYIILNLAQAYKWKGDEAKCREILEAEDTSAWKRDLLIPKLVLEDNYTETYETMRSVGLTGKILNKDLYRQWPIFKKLREQPEFADVFKEIFGEEVNQEKKLHIEEQSHIEEDFTSESEEKESSQL